MNTLVWSSNECAKSLLALSIFTAMKHVKELERIVVLTGYFGEDFRDLGLSEQSMDAIRSLVTAFDSGVQLDFIDCTLLYKEKLMGVNDDSMYSKFASLRLLIPLLGLRSEYNLVYLDVDTLVLRDFSHIWRKDIDSFDILAGVLGRGHSVNGTVKEFVGILRNSAVIVLNSDFSAMRLKRYTKGYKMFQRVELVLPDVQVINACLHTGGYDDALDLVVHEVNKEALSETFSSYAVDILHYTTEYLSRYHLNTDSVFDFAFYLTSSSPRLIRSVCLEFKQFCINEKISVAVVVGSEQQMEGEFE